MKQLKLILFLLLSSFCFAQKIIINQDKKQSLTKFIPYPFSLIGKNCESYIVTTNNGTISQDNSACKFIIYPATVGLAKITVQNKSGKIIAEETYNVNEINFLLEINNGISNIDDVERFFKSSRFTLSSPDLVCLDVQWDCQFELIHIQENNKYVTTLFSKNGRLDMLKENISSLKKGDILLFKNIKLLINKNEFNLPNIVLEVE